MKFVKYNPDNVVRLTTEPGRVTVIEIDKNENVVSKTYGSKEKWAIVSKDNTVQLGPKAQSGNTNLVIKTDKRLYFLDLIVTKNRGTYRVK
ncbi:TrbG/VirB9 family P-type conjugative transfer protein, partial [Burkholderia multivorans]|uniref:TrbG/VirB9 family P-type conjugative transfer protein n=1 Tax=Burkholderia multivorans TaxID=87883 RepID=UPI00286FD23E